MLCKAKRTNGHACKAQAIKGGSVCRSHGGAAPQVREAARRRLLELVDPAIAVLARAVRPRRKAKWEPTANELRAVSEILNRSGIGENETGAGDDGRVTWEEFLVLYRKRGSGDAETAT